MVGDTAVALDDYNRALRLDPHFAGAYNNRGALFGRQGRYDCAAADFQAAIDNDPLFSEAMLNLGLAKLDIGDMQAACMSWQAASRLGNPRRRQCSRSTADDPAAVRLLHVQKICGQGIVSHVFNTKLYHFYIIQRNPKKWLKVCNALSLIKSANCE